MFLLESTLGRLLLFLNVLYTVDKLTSLELLF